MHVLRVLDTVGICRRVQLCLVLNFASPPPEVQLPPQHALETWRFDVVEGRGSSHRLLDGTLFGRQLHSRLYPLLRL